jgi:uncharacterized protein RhaS with RHS repeats
MEGAGGIGGMLARSHGYSGGSWSTHNFYHADGGGNITALVDAGQLVSASYRYDTYGNQISASGGIATANVYRHIHPPTGEIAKQFSARRGLRPTRRLFQNVQ